MVNSEKAPSIKSQFTYQFGTAQQESDAGRTHDPLGK
jgi:hypothetical protein